MKRSTVLWALVALNAILLVALSWKLGGDNPAHAQAVARGEYVMVPAKLSGAPNGVVYMVDTRNSLLGGFIYDQNRRDLVPIPPINLNMAFERGPVR